jgi:hypothetical protein
MFKVVEGGGRLFEVGRGVAFLILGEEANQDTDQASVTSPSGLEDLRPVGFFQEQGATIDLGKRGGKHGVVETGQNSSQFLRRRVIS